LRTDDTKFTPSAATKARWTLEVDNDGVSYKEHSLSRMPSNIRTIILGSVVVVVAVAIGIWWYSGFSLSFMKFFAADLTPTAISCSPDTQTVKVGAQATLTAAGGAGTYAWTAPQGSPATQSTGDSFQVTYATAGTKKVLVQGARLENIDIVACTVVVTP
jgi:hypothetical protein